VLKEVEGVVIRNFEHSSYGISKETSATKSAHSKAAHPTKTKISAKQAAHLTAEKMFKWLKAELRRTARYFHTDVCSSPE
jgi:hypothetical protein